MAQYNGYRTVPHQSYQQWRNATFGNGYNVDNAYGNQCWDYCSLLYYQYGYTLITRVGGNGKAYQCWTLSRAINSRPPFVSIYNLSDVKRGDIVVLNTTTPTGNGHIAFADEDYNGNYMYLVGQNQGGYNGNVNRLRFYMPSRFLGAFRNTKWQSSPTPPTPTPPSQEVKQKFPWVVAINHWQNFKH